MREPRQQLTTAERRFVWVLVAIVSLAAFLYLGHRARIAIMCEDDYMAQGFDPNDPLFEAMVDACIRKGGPR